MLGNLSPTFCVYEFAHSRCLVNVESYNVSHFAFGVFLLGTVFSGFMHVMASVRISLLSKPNIVLCVSATCIPLLMNIYYILQEFLTCKILYFFENIS